MDRKTLLITGGDGFIGGFLKRYYKNTHTVLAPGRSVLDLTNKESVDDFFSRYSVDHVIHCALNGRDNINGVDDALCMNNVKMFQNLYRNQHKFTSLINMGTGNEFDTTTNLNHAPETMLFERMPRASYGLAKNLIARTIAQTENFYNLRLFGVFHHTENNKRFFKRLRNQPEEFHIFQDHMFDFVNIEDLIPMINCVMNGEALHRDVNICYRTKMTLGGYAQSFCHVHGLDINKVVIDGQGPNNFTGDPERFLSYGFKLAGLEAGMLKY